MLDAERGHTINLFMATIYNLANKLACFFHKFFTSNHSYPSFASKVGYYKVELSSNGLPKTLKHKTRAGLYASDKHASLSR